MQYKNIIVGVSGGIAAYKAIEIVSRLTKQDINVHVIMTKSAEKFVAPLTFQAISNQPVMTDMFDVPHEWDIKHISLAQKAELIVVAPATANIIGKVANGIADDMLTTTIMASKATIVFVPAMNTGMFENPIVQDNIKKLQNMGYFVMQPNFGRMACGTTGMGRLPEPEAILEYLNSLQGIKNDYQNMNVLLTAGPTIEPIDPVRYLSNYSSGKMGYAIAEEAIQRGANVTLVSGNVSLSPPSGAKVIMVNTAVEMYQATVQEQKHADIMIMVAAVADYRVKNPSDFKLKKNAEQMSVELVKNPDIAYELGKLKKNRILAGFCAETNDLLEHANAKLKNKNMDLIVANDITQEGAGFLKDTNVVTILHKNGNTIQYPKLSKREVAKHVLNEILKAKESVS